MRMHSFKILMGCVICASIFSSSAVYAKLYKWKDENGQTHYGDRIPTRYLDKERTELSNQGTVIKKTQRALTAEEIEEQKHQERIAEKKAEKLKEQQRRDRVLMDTYTTERDLIIARDARIDAVNSQLQLSESIIESANKKLTRTEKRIENIKERNREVPDDIYSKLNREKEQLDTHKKVADGHKRRLDAINKQFGAYISRFNELQAIKQKRRDAAAQRRKASY